MSPFRLPTSLQTNDCSKHASTHFEFTSEEENANQRGKMHPSPSRLATDKLLPRGYYKNSV